MKYLLFLLCLPAFALEIHPHGKIELKSDSLIFSKNCRAERSWPVISGLPNKKIEAKLNDEFRKIMSVGKRLKADDCPDNDSKEDFTYQNHTKIGAQRGDFLGLEFSIYFPGGSGRIVNDCRIYNLKTGKVFRPELYLAPGARAYAKKIFLERDKLKLAESEPEGMLNSKKPGPSPFCLDEDGLTIRQHAFGKTERRIKLQSSDRTKLFQNGPEFQAILP